MIEQWKRRRVLEEWLPDANPYLLDALIQAESEGLITIEERTGRIVTTPAGDRRFTELSEKLR